LAGACWSSGGSNAGTAGTAGSAGTTGSGGAGTTGSCTFTQTAATSTKIPTVGIVTFTTTLANPASAQIDFGLSTSYGLTAPVDLTQPSYRTLLLGMKASRTYHYRISASNGAGTCQGEDNTIATGPLPSGLTKPTVTTNDASALAGGFLITGQYKITPGATGAPAYILDADGDYVWWYTVAGSDATGVRMSYDGTHIWINDANVPKGFNTGAMGAFVHRVTMDGLTDEDFSAQFAGLNHQLTVLPDETVAFYAYGANGCEDIKLRAPDGTVTTVVNAQTAHGGTGPCHVNTIQYSKSDDTLVFSDLDNNCITKVTRTGATVWVLGGGLGGVTSSFTGDSWLGGEHGVHLLALDDILLFNNNSTMAAGGTTPLGGSGDGSIALELKLDLTGKTATRIWSYKASGTAYQNDVMGDVERLPNGNTLIAYSNKGLIREVDGSGAVLQELKTPKNFGYIEKRATLYGPPPR
jgi:hypothetical protein